MEEFNKETLLSEIKQLITDNSKGAVTEKQLNDSIAAINTKLETINNKENNHDEVLALKESVDALAEQLNKNSLEMKSLRENGIETKPAEVKNFRSALKAAILEHKDTLLKEVNDDYGKRISMKSYFEDGNRISPTITIKSAVDMLQSSINGNYVDSLRLTALDPQRVGTPLSIYPHVITDMPVKGITKPYMALLVVGTYVDGSATKTEGAASAKSSFLLTTVSFKAFYLATYFTLSDETLDDLEEVLDEISTVAPDKILDLIDTKILNGSAGDDATDIRGMANAAKHTAFDSTTYATTVKNATIIDLIAKAKLQAETAKMKPNEIWLNPLEVDNMAALKNDIADSVMDRRVVFDAQGYPVSVCGLRIKKNTEVTADTLFVIDRNQLQIGVRKDMNMEIGRNGTDLTEGQRTVVLKIRVAFGVRNKLGVVYSATVATDVAAINISA